MTFSSSPVLYPPSSSPPVILKKRKLFQKFPIDHATKRPKTIGGFLDEEQDEELGTHTHAISGLHGFSTLNPVAEDHSTSHSLESLALPLLEPVESSEQGSQSLPNNHRLLPRASSKTALSLSTSNGHVMQISLRKKAQGITFEQTIAQRSKTAPGHAKKSYYGVEVHKLIDEAKTQQYLADAQLEVQKEKEMLEDCQPRGETLLPQQLWTEKYRARKFTELVGDERTHRSVLRWLKGWDPVVFPGNSKTKSKWSQNDMNMDAENQHKKILLLTGPPGLGKTTLAHVCAKQAGYETLEINASDDRSRDVVRGRIKDALGTETVRGGQGKSGKRGRPVCVVVDEVDGAVTGSSGTGGEGGFIKALIDLVQIDQRNAVKSGTQGADRNSLRRKGDNFRLLRPLILICNDVYAPSLRPLRTSSFAEIIHVRKPPLDKVIARLKDVFEREGIPCDNDAIRRLCESSWGLGSRKQNSSGGRGAGEGDIRGVLVQGEWIARNLRKTDNLSSTARLTRKWLEAQLGESHYSGGQKGLGREGVREVVERVFLEGAGLPNLPTKMTDDDIRLLAESKSSPVSVTDLRKRAAILALRDMIDTCGEHDRLMSDCFATYPTRSFQDDVKLSKPNHCYEWLHFHDSLSSRVFSGQEWELSPYLSSSACSFHHLFASVDKGQSNWNEENTTEEALGHPFAGLRADFVAHEAEKQNRTIFSEMQSSFSGPLLRLFGSLDVIALELLPSVGQMLAPEVKPVVVGGSGGSGSIASVRKESEKLCIRSAARVMKELNISFEKVRIENEGAGAHSNMGYAFRMEPYVFTQPLTNPKLYN